MNIDITARNFTPSHHLKTFITTKLSSLSKYDSNIKSSKVVLLKEGRAEKVEILLRSNRNSYITKCYSSIFEKKNKLKKIVMPMEHFDNIKVQITFNQINQIKIIF